jgi:phenylpropionate dioxygenase-like ring-hydroxylating dioxygenase large terminal subunit
MSPKLDFLDDVWYCGALGEELGDVPLGRTICGQPIVLFRTAAGAVAALEDRCSHRQAPLSLGRLTGDTLQCGYHGFTFAANGTCTHIPRQRGIPGGAAIKAYTAVERWGLVWLWFGAGAADIDRIPALPWTTEADRRCVYMRYEVAANFQLMADNLMDVSHTDFLHATTIGSKTAAPGTEDDATIELDCRVVGDRVHFVRRVRDTLLGPVATLWAGSDKRVDRTNTLMWEPPNTIHSVLEFRNDETHRTIHLDHIMTPATETTMHYFMPWTRDFGLENVDYMTDDDVRREQNLVIAGDDIPMVEAQQRNIERFGHVMDVPTQQDRLVLTVHRVLAGLFRERGLNVPSELQRIGRAAPG